MQRALPCSPICALWRRVGGFVADDREYNSRLREVAIEKVRRQLKILVTAEQDLLQAVESLDDLSRVVNLLDERLYEWSRLRRQEIVHGKDLAEVLSQDPVTGELARTVLCLRRSHKAMETEVSRSVQSIAPISPAWPVQFWLQGSYPDPVA
jgi:hypothetical protein